MTAKDDCVRFVVEVLGGRRESCSADAFMGAFWTIGGTSKDSRASGAIACNKGHGKWAGAMQSELVPDDINRNP